MRPSLVRAPERHGRRLLLVNAALGPSELLFAPLGLLRLTAAIRSQGGDIEARIVSCRTPAEINAVLTEWEPAIVGLSALSAAMPMALALAECVRVWNEEVPVVLGGYHATLYPHGIAKYGDIDFYVRGEAIRSGPTLFVALLDGTPSLASIEGISYRSADGVVHAAPQALVMNLDDGPPVSWRDLELTAYSTKQSSAPVGPHLFVEFPRPVAPCTVTQGCPRHCGFCERISGREVRCHSPARVLSDLEELQQTLGATWVLLGDDSIVLNRRWFCELLDCLATGPDLRYWTGLNADLLDRELIDRMVDAGFGILTCFPESASSRVRDILAKQLAMDRLLENMTYASSQGLLTCATFFLGAPSETLAEVEASFALAREPVFDLVGFNQLILFGTTPLAVHLKRFGIVPDTPAYFDYLRAPSLSCVADYASSALNELTVAGKRINLEKLASPAVTSKLARLGLTVHPGVPLIPANEA
jgi:anaerobic magnesium-protoporphyrin IX monomethyl ester cyclase